jgi:peroxiredoxin
MGSASATGTAWIGNLGGATVSKLRKWGPVLALGVSLVFSITINVLQGRRIATIEDASTDAVPREETLIGTAMPTLHVVDIFGKPTIIESSHRNKPLLLYVFSPSCGWCRRNIHRINDLAMQITSRYDVVGLSLARDGLADFMKDDRMPFPVYTDPTPDTVTAYRLAITPETIVISSEGKVQATWTGAYLRATKSLVEQFFLVKLSND